MSRYFKTALAALIIGLFAVIGLRSGQAIPLESIKLPPGFSISIYARGLKNARQMAIGANGTLFVGSMNAGNVYAAVDRDKDNRADEIVTIATGLNMPSGITFHN